MEFLAAHKQATENDLSVVVIAFNDKISVMVHKRGKVGKVYRVALGSSVMGSHAIDADSDESMFPLPHLTPQPLIGGGSEDIHGKLYATQIASVISRQAPDEHRTIVVGLAADIGPRADHDITTAHKQELLSVIKLVQKCRVW